MNGYQVDSYLTLATTHNNVWCASPMDMYCPNKGLPSTTR